MLALGQLGLVPVLYAPGTGGIPATTRLLPDLRWRMQSLEWTITDQFGFESCTITFPAREDEALFWLDQLMASCVISDYDAVTCWEGLLLAVEVTIGSETHSRSLDGMQNRIRCRYTTVNGVPGVTSTNNIGASTGKYGIRDGVVTLDQCVSADADATRDAALSARGWPVRQVRTALQSDISGAASVTLRLVGWYDTLGWVLTSRTDTTTEASNDQIDALIDTSGVGIGVTNAFLSTATKGITSTGVSPSRFIAEDTPYRTKIEALAKQGTSAGERLAWGVYEDRVFYLTAWAGSTPDTLDYVRSTTDGLVRHPTGPVIPFWRVRPNTMVGVREFIGIATSSKGPGAGDRYPVGRVTFRAGADGLGLSLDPPESMSLDARLARLGGG